MRPYSIRALARAVDEKDWGTHLHSVRVAELAHLLALTLGWSLVDAQLLYDAGLVHDVGKISVPASVLSKAGKLTKAEWDLIRRHPTIGAEMLDEHAFTAAQISWVLHHHERPDGGGYPGALKRGEIPEGAAILGLCDSFDVMTHRRPYQEARTRAAALVLIVSLCERQFLHFAVRALEDVLTGAAVVEPSLRRGSYYEPPT